MALIPVTSGNVYQFTTLGTATTSVAQIAGSQEIYDKRFLTGLTVAGGNAATLTTETGSTAVLNGITEINGIHKFKYYDVVATNWTTSSLTTAEQWNVSGSFLMIRGAADHHVIPAGSGFVNLGRILKVMKRDDNSNLVTLDPQGITTINGSSSLSSSDPYAYIEMIQTSAGWRILNTRGTWT
jgi:hypothetical protein